jgi:hypothetical protein
MINKKEFGNISKKVFKGFSAKYDCNKLAYFEEF